VGKRSIDIDRVNIRLKGVSPESARAAVVDLGHDLIARLTSSSRDPGGQRTGIASHVAANKTILAPGATPSDLRQTIATRIADAIRSASKNKV